MFFFSLDWIKLFPSSTALQTLGTAEGPTLRWKNLILQLKAEALIKTADADAAEEAIKALEQVFSLMKMYICLKNYCCF